MSRQRVDDIFCQPENYNFMINFNNFANKTCKICLLEEEQNEENPLISPCLCKGSCESVHFQCLQTWIESKIQRKESENTVTYKWKNLECEVCKAPFPKSLYINGKEVPIVKIERPTCPYIILEGISKEKKVSKGLFLIHSVATEPAKLGRGHQCDIRVSDISVSRLHAEIKYQEGKFVITDNNSKFGTLIKLKSLVPVLKDKIALQVGRTVMTFVIKTQAQIDQQEKQQGQINGIQNLNTANINNTNQNNLYNFISSQQTSSGQQPAKKNQQTSNSSNVNNLFYNQRQCNDNNEMLLEYLKKNQKRNQGSMEMELE